MLAPDHQTADGHSGSSSFTYRKKSGTDPPHPSPPHQKSGSVTGNVTPEGTGPRQLPRADSLYKQKGNSEETL